MASRRTRVLAAVLVTLALAGPIIWRSGAWQWLYYGSQGFTIGAPETTYPVTNTLDDATGVRVAVVGDPGTGGASEFEVTSEMAAQHDERSYDALVLLGDLIYPDGELDLLDETVLEPFAPLIGDGVELLPALGNHDYRSDQSEDIMARLGRDSGWYAERVSSVLFIVLDSNQVDDPAQTKWLQHRLGASTAAWTIAAMHHPPYSAGVNGSDLGVRDAWAKLFADQGVDLVLAGHDHDYQRSVAIDGVVYVISGAGAKTRLTASEDFTAFSASTLHYLDLQITDDEILGQAIDTDGQSFDRFTIRNPG